MQNRTTHKAIVVELLMAVSSSIDRGWEWRQVLFFIFGLMAWVVTSRFNGFLIERLTEVWKCHKIQTLD